MTAPTFDLAIVKGKTFAQTFLYAEDQLAYRPISAVPGLAPARLTVAAHGVPDNWPVRIESVRAPAELNTPDGDYWIPAVVDANTLEINHLNLSTAKAFGGSGVLVYQQPADLTGWKARMQIRDRVGGTVLLSFSSDPADAADGTITVDQAGSAFVVTLDAAATAAISWDRAVYDLEAIKPDGSVISIIAPSRVIVGQEVTVWA